MQGSPDVPRGFRIKCALQCMRSLRCRAILISHDTSGNFACNTFDRTDTISAQPVYERIYPSPTTEGKLFYISKSCLTSIPKHSIKIRNYTTLYI